jgi:hypothetical protein
MGGGIGRASEGAKKREPDRSGSLQRLIRSHAVRGLVLIAFAPVVRERLAVCYGAAMFFGRSVWALLRMGFRLLRAGFHVLAFLAHVALAAIHFSAGAFAATAKPRLIALAEVLRGLLVAAFVLAASGTETLFVSAGTKLPARFAGLARRSLSFSPLIPLVVLLLVPFRLLGGRSAVAFLGLACPARIFSPCRFSGVCSW